MSHWTRRRLLSRLLGVLLVAAGLAWPDSNRPRRSRHGAPLWLAELLPDAGEAAAVGERVLAADSGTAAHARDLGRALRRRTAAAERRAWLGARRARDLRRDDIVLVDGWVMAATEAQLCALACLVLQRRT